MRVRQIVAVAAVVAAGLLPVTATPAAAAAKPAVGATAAAKAKPAKAKPAKAKPVKSTKPAKPVKKVVPVPFAASGTVSAVDPAAGTVTISVAGGTKVLRGTEATVTVAAGARIVVDEVRTTLDQVAVGYRISVNGTKVGAAWVATKLSASAPEADEPEVDEPDVDEPAV